MDRRFGRSLTAGFVGMAAMGSLGLSGCSGTYSPTTGTVFGGAEALGNGRASVFVTLDRDVPTSIGISLSPGALDNLPEENSETWLSLPAPGEDYNLPFTEIGLDWNIHGHEPPGIYDLPHFDMHFYVNTEENRAAIVPGAPSGPIAAAPDAAEVPTGYFAPPNPAAAIVPYMGVHYTSPSTSPEFQGQTFTSTFIYGFAFGNMTFLEPMVTRAFLQSETNFSAAIPQPTVYPKPGYYPTRYKIEHQPDGSIRILLDQFVMRG